MSYDRQRKSLICWSLPTRRIDAQIKKMPFRLLCLIVADFVSRQHLYCMNSKDNLFYYTNVNECKKLVDGNKDKDIIQICRMNIPFILCNYIDFVVVRYERANVRGEITPLRYINFDIVDNCTSVLKVSATGSCKAWIQFHSDWIDIHSISTVDNVEIIKLAFEMYMQYYQ